MKYRWANTINWNEPGGKELVCEGVRCQTMGKIEGLPREDEVAPVEGCRRVALMWPVLQCKYCGRKPCEDEGG